MAGQKFDSKSFNPEAFGGYVGIIPKLNRNELTKSRVLVANPTIGALLSSQTGSFYATMPIVGRIGGEADNYDGQTNIKATSMDTYEQSVIAIGRAKAWTEKDFSYEITGGKDFMDEVAKQVSEYWDDIDVGLIMSVIKGVFAMTGAENKKFVDTHTHDVTAQGEGKLQPTTLNTAIQKACGDNRGKFSLVFMHSAVATNLENQNLLEYLKYTDANGVQRPLPLASWNGRLVIVDDGMPFEDGYFDAKQGDEGALKVTTAGSGGDEVKLADVNKAYFGSAKLDGEGSHFVVKGVRYTTFVFGEGAIQFADLGAKVPYEMARDPKTNGGEDTLYTRKRMCFAPYGISFTKKSVATLSPTNAELEDGQNWELVHNGSKSAKTTIDPKAIAIARVFSRG